MPKTLSDREIERIKAKLSSTLGRELTAEECKYLGLSYVAVPAEDDIPTTTAPEIERQES